MLRCLIEGRIAVVVTFACVVITRKKHPKPSWWCVCGWEEEGEGGRRGGIRLYAVRDGSGPSESPPPQALVELLHEGLGACTQCTGTLEGELSLSGRSRLWGEGGGGDVGSLCQRK